MLEIIIPNIKNNENNENINLNKNNNNNKNLNIFQFFNLNYYFNFEIKEKNEKNEENNNINLNNLIKFHSFRLLFIIKKNKNEILFNYKNKWLNFSIKINHNSCINYIEWEYYSDRLFIGTNKGILIRIYIFNYLLLIVNYSRNFNI